MLGSEVLMIYDDIIGTVGHTPVVRINRLVPRSQDQIYLKLESFNPTASIKDRAAVYMIQQAERTNLLKPGSTIIESTSGNLGKSLAMIGAVRGYRVIIVADPKVPRPVLAFYEALGAKVEIVDQPDENGSFQKPRIQRVKELLQAIPNSYWPNQYDNPDNPRVHTETTAREILADFDYLDVLVASVSTGGHMSGIAGTLKQHMSNMEVVAVDAVGSAVFNRPYKPYLMNGIGLSWRSANLDARYIDRVQLVSDTEAFSTCRLLARHEGILIGGSAGAVLFACLTVAQERQNVRRVLGIAPDTGMNYLEELFDHEWLHEKGLTLVEDLEELFTASKRAISGTIVAL